MAITVLTTPPNPPNSDAHRAMFMWCGGAGAADPLDTDPEVNSLISFCGTVGNDIVFLDIYRYLGGANWTAARAARVRVVVDGLKRSGVRVLTLAGDLGWGTNHAWVMDNIVSPVERYNAGCTKTSEMFDGICLDVEYWTDEANYPPSTNCPGLCELLYAIKHRNPSWWVGIFAGFGLTDSGRTSIVYNGKTQVDGYHLMDAADFVVVGDYRDTAADPGGGQIGINSCHQPWHDYASAEGRSTQLFVGVETINVSPSNITFYGQGKGAMETQLTAVATQFKGSAQSSYVGACVHDYGGWSAMGA